MANDQLLPLQRDVARVLMDGSSSAAFCEDALEGAAADREQRIPTSDAAARKADSDPPV